MKNIVLGRVTLEPLSVDIMVKTGELIRDKGLNTKLKSSSLINGAGVGLFVAGVERMVEDNSTIYVSSWKTNSGKYGADIDINDSIHTSQIDYYNKMLGDVQGKPFYIFSLNKKGKVMSNDEISEYGLVTQ